MDFLRDMEQERIIKMCDLLIHRGPDDRGVFIHNNYGIGMCRLSIIDLIGGHQPMSNEDQTLWIVYNGELYNHVDIRKELMVKGHIFRTRSDTEVIIHAYEEFGINCLKYFNGMFAIAIIDLKSRTLFIARDRMGIKPLYYVLTEDIFIFSSEIKAILSQPEIDARLNRDALAEYMSFRFICGAETLFENINELEPGTYLLLQDGKISVNRYWNCSVSGEANISENDAVEQVETILRDSVRLRMMSEVPIGTINSGGIDSSLVSCYLSQMAEEPIDTFCVGFDEQSYDERPYAHIIANHINSKHHEIVLTSKILAEHLPRLVWYNDEPLNHPNSIPMYLIFQYAQQEYGVKVMLSGEGADELFGGYGWYITANIKQQFYPYRSLIRVGAISGYPKLCRWNKILNDNNYLISVNQVLPSETVRLVMPDFLCKFENRERLFRETGCRDFTSRMLYYDQHAYLVSLLQRQDRMSMAASIEARVPFLDHRVVEFVNTLSADLKVKRRITKYLLKQVARKRLPAKIVDRKKVGFGIPLGKWFRQKQGLKSYIDLLVDTKSTQRGLFEPNAVEHIIDEHLKERADHGNLLWSLVNIEIWLRIFVDRMPEYRFTDCQ